MDGESKRQRIESNPVPSSSSSSSDGGKEEFNGDVFSQTRTRPHDDDGDEENKMNVHRVPSQASYAAAFADEDDNAGDEKEEREEEEEEEERKQRERVEDMTVSIYALTSLPHHLSLPPPATPNPHPHSPLLDITNINTYSPQNSPILKILVCL